MDFYTVLDQVLALLRQRGLVSYRALQRQFALDNAYLADLKDALVFEEKRCCAWRNVPKTPRSRLSPTMPSG
jgi:hypothetical protein